MRRRDVVWTRASRIVVGDAGAGHNLFWRGTGTAARCLRNVVAALTGRDQVTVVIAHEYVDVHTPSSCEWLGTLVDGARCDARHGIVEADWCA